MVQSGAAVQAEHCAVTQTSDPFLPARATFKKKFLNLAVQSQIVLGVVQPQHDQQSQTIIRSYASHLTCLCRLPKSSLQACYYQPDMKQALDADGQQGA